MADLKAGDDVMVIECDDSTRRPRAGGQQYPARVVAAGETYTTIKYDDRLINGDRADQFWSESGWRAWDGKFRWRLEPFVTAPVTPAAAEGER